MVWQIKLNLIVKMAKDTRTIYDLSEEEYDDYKKNILKIMRM